MNIPEYLAPGVYIEEFEIGAKPIEGVSTSTAGFVGFAVRGPLNRPTLVTSFAEYQSIFGGYLPDDNDYKLVRWLPYAVEGFFSNGGKRAYIVRVAGEKAASSTGFIPDISGNTVHLVAETKPGSTSLLVRDTNLLKNDDVVFIRDGTFSECIKIDSLNDVKALTLTNPLESKHAASIDIKKLEVDSGVAAFKVKAKLKAGATEIILDKTTGLNNGNVVLLDKDDNVEVCKISAVTSEENTITLSSPLKLGHDIEAPLKKLSDPTAATKASVEIKAGDRIIPVDSATGLQQNDVIKIEDEYFYIKNVEPVKLLIPKDKLRYGHKKGTGITQLVKAINVTASSEGKWGDQLKVMVNGSSLSKTSLTEAATSTDTLTLSTVNGIEKGTLLMIEPDVGVPIYRTVKEVTSAGKKVVLTDTIIGIDKNTSISTVEFDLKIRFNGSEESFKYLSMSPEHSRYVLKIISEESSRLIKIEDVSGTQDPAKKIPMPTQDAEPGWLFAGGNDGIPIENEIDETYTGNDDTIPEKRKGLYTLKNIEDISIVAVPGIATQTLQDKIITHCEEMKDRFAVLDPMKDADLDKIQYQRNLFDSKYAALYYPWVQVYDPMSKKQINVPPSGHVCGIYARSDTERGVHKAPANEKLNGVLDLEKTGSGSARIITKDQQEILNPKGINCIIPFPGRGIRVWGARTISSDSLWKYINVRRLFIYIEKSIEKGTQWVVFEPNNERLWGRVRATITQFLTGVWRDGALMGTKPEEAFFVKCDRSTMTQDDIDNGRLICIIGIAPVKPAEFVIFRIAQWAGGSAATE